MLGWLRSSLRREVSTRVEVPETRNAMSAGFTAQILAARESYITGLSGLAELTSTAQGCVSSACRGWPS